MVSVTKSAHVKLRSGRVYALGGGYNAWMIAAAGGKKTAGDGDEDTKDTAEAALDPAAMVWWCKLKPRRVHSPAFHLNDNTLCGISGWFN